MACEKQTLPSARSPRPRPEGASESARGDAVFHYCFPVTYTGRVFVVPVGGEMRLES